MLGFILGVVGTIASTLASALVVGSDIFLKVATALTAFANALGITDEKDPEKLGDKIIQAEEEGIKPEKYEKYEDYMKAIDEFEIDEEKSKEIDTNAKLLRGVDAAAKGIQSKFPEHDVEGFINSIALSDENKDAIVSSAFDYSIVKRLKGKIPKKSTYVFLFKKISHTYDSEHDDVGGDVSLNMAFEFDDYKQFVLFSNAFESYEKNEPLELAKILADCIAPDISITKYKLSIQKKIFDVWLRSMIDNQQSIETERSRLQWQLGIITDSNEKNLYSNDLQEIFNFDTINENGDEVGIKYLEGAMYIYPAKKKESFQVRKSLPPKQKSNRLLKILVITLIVTLIVVLIIMISINNHVNAIDIDNNVDIFLISLVQDFEFLE